MVTCPFNAKHVVPRPEERHHIQTCVDKVLIEADAEHNTRLRNNEYQGNISVPPYFPDKDIQPATESWDDGKETCIHKRKSETRPGLIVAKLKS